MLDGNGIHIDKDAVVQYGKNYYVVVAFNNDDTSLYVHKYLGHYVSDRRANIKKVDKVKIISLREMPREYMLGRLEFLTRYDK